MLRHSNSLNTFGRSVSRKGCGLFAIAASIMVSVSIATGTTYYVDVVNGSNSNSGSAAAPFRTISHALSITSASDVIRVNAGVYDASSGEIFPLTIPCTVILSGNVTINGNVVVSSGLMTFGTKILAGTGKFTVAAGGTLSIGSPAGISASGASGNIQMTDTRSFSTGANFSYDGTSSQVTGDGLPSTVNGLTINNIAGVTLSRSTTVSGTLVLSNGIVYTTNASLVRLSPGSAVSGGSAAAFVHGPLVHLWNGTETKVFPIGKGTAFRPLEVMLTNPAALELRAEIFNGNAGGSSTLDAISSVRYYQTSILGGTAAGGGTVKITFGADDGVSPGQEGGLVIAQSTVVNGAYVSLGQSANSSNSVVSGMYDPASGDFLLLGSMSGNPLPIRLVSFTASEINGASLLLRWATMSEVNNYGFVIQSRQLGDTEFSDIPGTFVAGHGTTTVGYSYSQIIAGVVEHGRSYRLKQCDLDGSIHFSDHITLTLTGVPESAPEVFRLSQNYPNPFNPSTTIRYGLSSRIHVALTVFNTLGQQVSTLVQGEQDAGYHEVKFDGSSLPSGVYFYRMQAGSYTETKKLLLIR